jgi:hypothetical protein
MDERLEKAFETANYMATLSNQKRIVKEEFNQKLMYYVNGGTFKVGKELIAFTKTVIDAGHTSDVVFIDDNQLPVIVEDVSKFLADIVHVYFEAANEYAAKISQIKTNRKLTNIVDL